MSKNTTPSKTRKETRRIKMVFELAKDLQEDEVICEHCHGTGAESVIGNACDGLHEDAGEICDSGSLQKVLDEWCAKQVGTETYWPDYKNGFYIPQGGKE
jgi:hypothetical protein